MQTQELFIGIDVSKAQLDGSDLAGELTFPHPTDPRGIASVVSLLKTRQPTLIVLEATGGFEFPLAAALTAAGLPVAVVNPRQVRDFARATGQLANTDTIDAGVLAHFGQAIR